MGAITERFALCRPEKTQEGVQGRAPCRAGKGRLNTSEPSGKIIEHLLINTEPSVCF